MLARKTEINLFCLLTTTLRGFINIIKMVYKLMLYNI